MRYSRFSAIAQFFGQESTLLGAYLLVTILATLQQYLLPNQPIGDSPIAYTNYNNYVIFKQSFAHLLTNQNLYSYYPAEQWDLYKYSPTFALLMGLFAYLPNWLGLLGWNMLNTLPLFLAIRQLPHLSATIKASIRWFVLLELATSIQNSQSNGLILGLLLWSFIYLERDKPIWATLCMLGSVFIKLFGIVGFVLFLLYPGKKQAAGSTVFWALCLTALPLLVVSPGQLIEQYQNWAVLLKSDHSTSLGLSVMGWLTAWFSLNPPKLAVVLGGAGLLLLPLLRTSQYKAYSFRVLVLASLLIWVVIFNHKAESPTFIIAMGGVAIWYFTQPITFLNRVLVLLTFVFTSVSPTDVFPAVLRDAFVLPYVLKGAACIMVWLKLTADLLTETWITTNRAVAIPEPSVPVAL